MVANREKQNGGHDVEKYTNFIMIEDNKENKDHSLERGRATLIFSLKNEVGGLIKALKIFQLPKLVREDALLPQVCTYGTRGPGCAARDQKKQSGSAGY